ncbi:MAG: T9SS type A sorting domain-containing protein [Ignavibacteria bacterium]|nr:T9SS type A sorting domain-containing protein [Ignavibacteria bacterium]
MNSGAENFNVAPGEKQTIVIAQLIARGSSNLNSVTKLKQLAQYVRNFYDNNFPINIEFKPGIIPDKFALEQNYPNPFNSITSIKFSIPLSHLVTLSPCHIVTLKVFDLLGCEVATLINENLQPGTYEVTFDAGALASGVYFYRLTAGNFSETKKLVLMK